MTGLQRGFEASAVATAAAVPEPTSLVLAGVGLTFVLVYVRLRQPKLAAA